MSVKFTQSQIKNQEGNYFNMIQSDVQFLCDSRSSLMLIHTLHLNHIGHYDSTTVLTLPIPLAPYDVVQSDFVLYLHLDPIEIFPLW